MSTLSLSFSFMGTGTAAAGALSGGGGGGGSGSYSGDPGSQTGFTDFSEFAVASGTPTGITDRSWNNTISASGIGNDGTEGNYFHWTPGVGDYDANLFTLDSFDGAAMSYGEVLARVWVPTHNNNRRLAGPAMHVEGDGTAGNTNFNAGGIYTRNATDYESTFLRVTNGGGGVVAGPDLQEAEQTSVWVWIRIRLVDQGANDDWYIKAWYGAIGDEPASWGGSSLGVFKARETANNLGWAVIALQRLAEQRIAYLSFSEDPDTTPPPVPV